MNRRKSVPGLLLIQAWMNIGKIKNTTVPHKNQQSLMHENWEENGKVYDISIYYWDHRWLPKHWSRQQQQTAPKAPWKNNRRYMPGDFQGFESLLSSRLHSTRPGLTGTWRDLYRQQYDYCSDSTIPGIGGQRAELKKSADSEQSRKNHNNKTIGHTVLYGISYYIPVLGYSSHTPTEFWNWIKKLWCLPPTGTGGTPTTQQTFVFLSKF